VRDDDPAPLHGLLERGARDRQRVGGGEVCARQGEQPACTQAGYACQSGNRGDESIDVERRRRARAPVIAIVPPVERIVTGREGRVMGRDSAFIRC